MNMLVIKANDRPSSQAVSTKMYETFMENIEGVDITVYDVFAEDTPYFGQQFFDVFAKLQSGEQLNEEEARLMAAKQKAMDLLSAADVVVLAFPLWNLTIPAKLQTFVDYVYQSGYTFKFTPEGQMVSLMTDKKAIILNARGGVYSTPETASLEMSSSYIRNIFGGVFGLEIAEEVIIEGHNAFPDRSAAIIEEGLEKVKEVAKRYSKALVN